MDYPTFTPHQLLGIQLRDQELVQWLDKRLGDKQDIWTCRSVASFLSKDMVNELATCFQSLETHVKLKIVMGFVLLQHRHLVNWREEINTLLSISVRDPDEWLELISDMFKNLSPSGSVSILPLRNPDIFLQTLHDVSRLFRVFIGNHPEWVDIPKTFEACNHSVLKAKFGITELEVKQHFTLRRRAKSTILKSDVLKSLEEQAAILEQQRKGIIISNLPIKIRSTLRKPDILPMKGIPNAGLNKISGGFTNDPKKFQRTLAKREGGAKLIAIDEIPQALKRRRKDQEDEEKKKKAEEKEAAKRKIIEEKAAARKAALAAQEEAKKQAEQRKKEKLEMEKQIEMAARRAQNEADEAARALEDSDKPSRSPSPQPCSSSQGVNDRRPKTNLAQYLLGSDKDKGIGKHAYQNLKFNTTIQRDTEWLAHKARVIALKSSCEDVLKNSNRLDERGQRLVVAFMSGNKCHPSKAGYLATASFRDGMKKESGNVITMKLSEKIEDTIVEGVMCKALVETFFQMDYDSGEWKRLRKCKRLLDGEENYYYSIFEDDHNRMTSKQIEECIEENVRIADQAKEDEKAANQMGAELAMQEQDEMQDELRKQTMMRGMMGEVETMPDGHHQPAQQSFVVASSGIAGQSAPIYIQQGATIVVPNQSIMIGQGTGQQQYQLVTMQPMGGPGGSAQGMRQQQQQQQPMRRFLLQPHAEPQLIAGQQQAQQQQQQQQQQGMYAGQQMRNTQQINEQHMNTMPTPAKRIHLSQHPNAGPSGQPPQQMQMNSQMINEHQTTINQYKNTMHQQQQEQQRMHQELMKQQQEMAMQQQQQRMMVQQQQQMQQMQKIDGQNIEKQRSMIKQQQQDHAYNQQPMRPPTQSPQLMLSPQRMQPMPTSPMQNIRSPQQQQQQMQQMQPALNRPNMAQQPVMRQVAPGQQRVVQQQTTFVPQQHFIQQGQHTQQAMQMQNQQIQQQQQQQQLQQQHIQQQQHMQQMQGQQQRQMRMVPMQQMQPGQTTQQIGTPNYSPDPRFAPPQQQYQAIGRGQMIQGGAAPQHPQIAQRQQQRPQQQQYM